MSYYYYVTPDRKSIGIVDSSGVKYSGDVRVIYSKHDVALSNDNDEPSFDETYQMAIVYKVLELLGYPQFIAQYRNEKRAARHSKCGPVLNIKPKVF